MEKFSEHDLLLNTPFFQNDFHITLDISQSLLKISISSLNFIYHLFKALVCLFKVKLP